MASDHHISVLLADDHQVVRYGVRRALEGTPDITVVGEAGSGDQALSMLKELRPDVMICDVRLPDISGIEVVRHARENSPVTRSLVLSAHDEDDYVLEAMAAGASGYLLKTMDVNRLPEAVRRVHAGETVLYPPVSQQFSRLLSGDALPANDEPLTTREREILGLAAHGLRNKDIADRLGLSVRTVEGHFARIFVKLSVESRLEAVRAGIARGLLDDEQKDRDRRLGA